MYIVRNCVSFPCSNTFSTFFAFLNLKQLKKRKQISTQTSVKDDEKAGEGQNIALGATKDLDVVMRVAYEANEVTTYPLSCSPFSLSPCACKL